VKRFPKLRVAGSNPVSRSNFRSDDEGFQGDLEALRRSSGATQGRRDGAASSIT